MITLEFKKGAGYGLFIIGLILFVDQLYLFGIPFGPFLPDLSTLDPTGSDFFKHWMLGLVLMPLGFYFASRVEDDVYE